MMKLPNRDSTAYRNGLRAVDDEPTWADPCEWLDSFFCPEESLKSCFDAGRWKIDRWIVDGLIRSGSVCLVAGPSNVGKTYIALDLAISVVLGDEFLGYFLCDRGPVVYIGGEGNKDMIMRRIVNILRGHEQNENEFFSSDKWKYLKVSLPSDFAKKYNHPLQNHEYIESLKWHMHQIPVNSRPRLFVWDPLSALVRDVDHDPSVIQGVINDMRELNRLCDACSIIIHHPKKAQANAPTDRRNMIRGESSWVNFVDDVLVVEAEDENPSSINFWSNKSRDSASAKDSSPMFSMERKFEAVEQIPDSTPGAVQKVIHKFSAFHVPKKKQEEQKQKKEDKSYGLLMNAIEDIIHKTNEPVTQARVIKAYGESSLAVKDGSLALALSQLVMDSRIRTANGVGPESIETVYFHPSLEFRNAS